MAKNILNQSLNLPVAINWWDNILANNDVPPIQQLTMFHIICRLNKNFWAPAQVSISKLAAVMNSDVRTVKKAVDALIASNWLVCNERGMFINVNGKSTYNACTGAVVDSSVVSFSDYLSARKSQAV